MLLPPRLIGQIRSADGGKAHGESFNCSETGLTKRSEIVLGIDDVGISVWGIRRPGCVTSRSFLPGEKFLCAPTSVTSKHGNKKNSKGFDHERFTYWASRKSRFDSFDETRIYCLYDLGLDSKVSSQPTIDQTAHGSMRFLIPIKETRPKSQAGHLVLAITAHGQVTCYGPKLDSTKWSARLPSFDGKGITEAIAAAVVFSEREGRSGILSSKGHIVAQDASSAIAGDQNQDNQCLAILDKSDIQCPKLRCYRVDEDLEPILTLSLPYAGEFKAAKTVWSIHPKAGAVQRVDSGEASRLSSYDVARSTPSLTASFNFPGISSITRISSSLVAATSTNGLQLIDTKWGSVHDEGTLYVEGSTYAAFDTAKLLTYSPSAKSVVVLLGDQLLSVSTARDLDTHEPTAKRRRVGTLASAVGRGIGKLKYEDAHTSVSTKPFGKKLDIKNPREDIKKFEETFDPLLTEKDINNYDTHVLEALEKAYTSTGNSHSHLAKPAIIDYAIRNMFQLIPVNKANKAGDMSLEIKRMAPEVFRFLLTRGFVSTYQISRSLASSSRSFHRPTISAAAIVDALVAHDESLQALIYYLSSAPICEADELVFAIAHVIRLDMSVEQEEAQKLLLNGKANGTDHAAHSIQLSEAVSKENDMQYPENVDESAFDGDWPDPEAGEGASHNARSALRSCLTRLSLCSEADIRRAMKANMQPSGMLVLIDYLRIELAGGGWLVHSVEDDPEDRSDLSSQTSQISILAKVLNCAVDSLGISGALSGSADEGDSQSQAEKLQHMRVEINAALAGIQDSTALEQLLREVLLFSKSSEQVETGKLVDSASYRHGSLLMPNAFELRKNAMLPFGLRKSNVVAATKKGPGGKDVPMSKRHIAYLENKAVPEYSFERIEI